MAAEAPQHHLAAAEAEPKSAAEEAAVAVAPRSAAEAVAAETAQSHHLAAARPTPKSSVLAKVGALAQLVPHACVKAAEASAIAKSFVISPTSSAVKSTVAGSTATK